MADIDIERKRSSIWPWIVGLIALFLLIWLLSEMFVDDDAVEAPVAGVAEPALVAPAPVPVVGTAEAPVAAATAPPPMPAAVQQYATACAPREPAAMGMDHQYTSNCIQQLVSAVEATLQNPNLAGVDIQAQMQDARQKAEQLVQSSNQSAQHAGMTREAFMSIATLLNGVQDARYPSLDGHVTQLAETARSIQTTGNLLDQREPVQRFFQQAGDVLNAMSTMPPLTG